MKSAIIEVNGVEVCAFSNGEIERLDGRSNEVVKDFGTPSSIGYRRVSINGKTALVHRIIASAFIGNIGEGLVVDHINGDGLDNRPENLRITTNQQNAKGFNKPRVGSSSKYRGVCWLKRSRKWKASIGVSGTAKYLGLFSVEEDAAKCYNSAALDLGFSAEALNEV